MWLDLVWLWLWLWLWPAATALIQPLAWEPPYAVGVAPKNKKTKQNKTKQNEPLGEMGFCFQKPKHKEGRRFWRMKQK